MLTWNDAQQLKRGQIIYQELKVKLGAKIVFIPWQVVKVNQYFITVRQKVNRDEMDIPQTAFPMTNLYLEK